MYFREHQPPHFHAVYGEDEALISVETLGIVAGWLPPRVMGLVVEWASLHEEEFNRNWDKVCNHAFGVDVEPELASIFPKSDEETAR